MSAILYTFAILFAYKIDGCVTKVNFKWCKFLKVECVESECLFYNFGKTWASQKNI
jgi:hypothetical protein